MSTTGTPSIHRPSLTLLGTEPWRAAYEFVQHKIARKAPVPRGDGHPVIIFPGLGTDGAAVAPLRDYCEAQGYSAMDWGRGFNTGPQGDIDTWLAGLAEHVSGLLAGHTQRATLIGWSLGGIYARELGKLMAPRLRQVITIGTPFNGLPDHTHAGWLFRLLNGAEPVSDPALSQRLRTPPPMPTTSIYSRSDGVVAWQSCCHEQTGALVCDLEVKGSHIGMGWNPAVLKVVAERLARPGAAVH